MIPQNQQFDHDPGNGVYGDCHRACIASILDMDINMVPHFAELAYKEFGEFADDITTAKIFQNEVENFLFTQGLSSFTVPYSGDCTLEEIMSTLEYYAKNVYFILGGMSKRGNNHSVVCCGGDIVFDPNNSTGKHSIVGPMKCIQGGDFYFVTFFIPLSLTKREVVQAN